MRMLSLSLLIAAYFIQSTTEKPASDTAALSLLTTSSVSSPFTLISPFAALAFTAFMPSIAETAFSTEASQWLQVIPVTLNTVPPNMLF